MTRAELDGFAAAPTGPLATQLLDNATSRIITDLWAYAREPNPERKAPTWSATIARETHVHDPLPAGGLHVQVNFAYSDGFGRVVQAKVQAEPGPVPARDLNGSLIVDTSNRPVMQSEIVERWVGSGWTVFNNKGQPVRQFEPFFTDTHRYEFDVRVGVSPVVFYDPVGRIVGTLRPDHTWGKVVFGPWQQTTWDVSDTLLDAPERDPDVGQFFSRLSEVEYTPT